MKNSRVRHLYGDRSIRITTTGPGEAPRYIGSIAVVEKHTKWKTASKKTMEELASKGVLNQDQLDKMEDEGFNIHEANLKHKIECLNLEDNEDFAKFVALAKEDPETLRVMDKINTQKKREATRRKNRALEDRIRSINLDTAEGMKAFADLAKKEPNAMSILEKIAAKR